MGNREYYEMKLEVIRAIEDDKIKTPQNIPLGIYTQDINFAWHLFFHKTCTFAPTVPLFRHLSTQKLQVLNFYDTRGLIAAYIDSKD
jgi:hypothetical protein